ncbi:MAG: ABC transporter ATP-binding protein, partial [Oscillospiraceae bacterium]
MAKGNVILKMENLCFSYSNGYEALKNINLEIYEGEKIAVLGANGAGKSTLFLCLNGIYKKSNGKYIFNGKEVGYSKKELIALRQDVGVVFQQPENQIIATVVEDEVGFGAMNLRLSSDEVDLRIKNSLQAVEMLEHRTKPVHFLSYGQKKRVSIASVLAMNPKVIAFDEPTSSLDPYNTFMVDKIIEKLNNEGKTVIVATHDINSAYSWA